MLSLRKSVLFLPSYAPGNRGTASTNAGLIEIAGFLLWKWPCTLRWHGNSGDIHLNETGNLLHADGGSTADIDTFATFNLKQSSSGSHAAPRESPAVKGQITGKKKRAQPARRAATA